MELLWSQSLFNFEIDVARENSRWSKFADPDRYLFGDICDGFLWLMGAL
jgi:hypothetical protein